MRRRPISATAVRSVALLLVLVLVAGTAVYEYRAIHDELSGVALLRREAVASLASTVLAEKFGHVVDVGIALATRVRFRRLVAEGRWVEAMTIMDEVPADLPLLERLFLADRDGILWADTPALPGVRGESFAYREWFQGVSRNWQPFVSPVYTRAAEPRIEVLAVAVPVRDFDGSPIAVLVLQIRSASLVEWIGDIDSDDRIHVIDPNGRIVASTGTDDRSSLQGGSSEVIVRLGRGERGAMSGFDPLAGEEAIIAYAPVPGSGWGVATVQPLRTSIEIRARDEQLRTLVTGYLFIVALIVAAAVMGSRIAVHQRLQAEDRRRREELERQVRERTATLREVNARLEREIEAGKNRQAVLQRYADDIEDLYNHAPCGYHSLDADGLVVRMNDTELEWLGYARDEVVGVRRFPELVAADDREAFLDNLARLKASGRVSDVEYRMVRKDGGSFPASVSSSAVVDERGAYLASRSILMDISERKRAESEIDTLNAELSGKAIALEAANRELEAFSYSVSHDLRAPLRAIDGFSQALLEDYDSRLDGQGRDFLRRVRSASQRMAELIDDLLKLARVSRWELQWQPVDLGAMAAETVAGLREAEPDRVVTLDIGGDLDVRGDPRLLRLVVDNLLGNAWKFTARTSDARIEFGRDGHEGGAPRFFIRDNGVGFDPTYGDKLFKPFQRLHGIDEFPGTGIGLATVQRIVHRHGGRVSAEGRPGQGATFRFSIAEQAIDQGERIHG